MTSCPCQGVRAMSDLYLVLRSRLDDVSSWVSLGVDVIRDAQHRVGLSDERLARQIPVSTRTWIRWRDRGQVPTHSLERVAALLDLQVERSERPRVTVEEVPSDRLGELEDRVLSQLESMQATLEDLGARVEAMSSRPAGSTARRKSS